MIIIIFFGILIGIPIYNWEKILLLIIRYYNILNETKIINPKLNDIEETSGMKIKLEQIDDKPKSNMKKTKSQNFIISEEQDNITEQQILYSYIRSNDFSCPNYSITFSSLSKIIPKHSKSMEHLNELVKNRTYNIELCCNPDCRKSINGYYFCAYDGYYCSVNCRSLASHYMAGYWEKV